MPTLHAILRDRRRWDRVEWSRLTPAEDGALELIRLPGSVSGVHIAEPYRVSPSGLAVSDCNELYLTDSHDHQLVFTDLLCDTRTLQPISPGEGDDPGQFSAPHGLWLDEERNTLYIADAGNGRIQKLNARTLEVKSIWTSGMDMPVDLAGDSEGRVYVLDAGKKTVLRFDPRGVIDAAYVLEIPVEPAFMAIDARDRLYVADVGSNAVVVFDDSGSKLEVLPAPQDFFQPGAIALSEFRLYIANAATGRVEVFDFESRRYIGAVAGYRGPVAAMAVDRSGRLYVKPDGRARYVDIDPQAFVAPTGELVSERLDAGASGVWSRIVVEAEIPAGTQVEMRYFSSDGSAPAEEDWRASSSLDTLVYPEDATQAGRYLWLRIQLVSTDHTTSPRLVQVRAEAGEMRYLNYLPALYGRESRNNPFFQQWLALFEAQHRDLEYQREAVPYRVEPDRAPADHLDYLASWLAFEPPANLEEDELRELLPRLVEKYQRRGTREGLIEWIRLYTGISVRIHEAFQDRAFWQLDAGSGLGFSTRLPAVDPDGFVVPDAAQRKGAWSDPDRMIVGDAVVGLGGPLPAADLGETLFQETAHYFCVTVAACDVEKAGVREALLEIIEKEKPAHTGFGLNVVGAAMRIGYQSTIGVDAIVAGPDQPMRLEEAHAGLDSILPELESESRIGRQARLGKDVVVG